MNVGGFLEGLTLALGWPTIGFMVLGILVGITIGALPGIGPTLGMAILLPFTLPLPPAAALILLIGIYAGAMYGGCISGILLNAPGTASAAATALDGYEMSKAGKARTALAISATSSALGGMLTMVTLILLVPFVTEIVRLFGAPEYTLAALSGIALIAIVAKGALRKGIAAGAFGLMITTVGIGPDGTTARYTFGSLLLYDGLSFIAIIIGLFAVGEMIKLASRSETIAQNSDIEVRGSIMEGVRFTLSHPVKLIKSSFIGMSIGSIPGAGGSTASFFAYGEELRSSEKPESYGKGNPAGVLCAESADNGCVAGSVLPTIAFGIPGSAATAVLLGGFVLHGLTPGPDLFGPDLHITYSLLIGLFIANIVILVVGLGAITELGRITRVNTDFIVPVIIILSVLGSFLLRQNWIDPLTVVVFGFIGFYMKEHNYSIIALVLGAILGPIIETNLIRSLQISEGSWMIFVSRPVSIVLILLTVALIVVSTKDMFIGILDGST